MTEPVHEDARPRWMCRDEFDGSYVMAMTETDDGYKCYVLKWTNGTGFAVVVAHDASERWIVSGILQKPPARGAIARLIRKGLTELRVDAAKDAPKAAH